MSTTWMLGLVSGVGLLGLASVLTGGAGDATTDAGAKRLRAVVHINFADAERQKKGLKNVRNILKAEPSADVEVVCHGAGIGLVIKDENPSAAEVESLAAEGVKFLACENTLQEKSISREALLPHVSTVPSGAVEVIRRQQQGAGYFRP